VWGVWGCGVRSLLTFDIPQTALVATLDTYDFIPVSSYFVYLFLLFNEPFVIEAPPSHIIVPSSPSFYIK
jgi:hypothetical protein